MSGRDLPSDAAAGRLLIAIALIALFAGMPISFALLGAARTTIPSQPGSNVSAEAQKKLGTRDHVEEEKSERDAAFWRNADGSTRTYEAICNKPIDHDNADLCQQWRTAQYARYQVALGTLTLIGLGLTIIFTIRGFVLTRRATEAATEATQIAETGMIAGNRAYVHFSGCRYISHTAKDGQIFWRVRPLWRNHGNTPTRDLRVYVGYYLENMPIPDDYDFSPKIPGEWPKAIIPPHDTIVSYTYDVWGRDLAAVLRGEMHFYVWGIAYYRDVYPGTEEHVTKFCLRAANISGDPEKFWDANLPVEIMFTSGHWHNCADEDCDQACA